MTVFDNPAASPPVAASGTSCPTSSGGLVGSGGTGVPVATATPGLGTDMLAGTLTLTAPVATQSGVFAGIITFTVGKPAELGADRDGCAMIRPRTANERLRRGRLRGAVHDQGDAPGAD